MKTQHDTPASASTPEPSKASPLSPSAAKKPDKSTPGSLGSSTPVPQKVWDDLHQNLTQALGRWERLSQEADHKISPEEEQLQEVKRLLEELKNKLREFSR